MAPPRYDFGSTRRRRSPLPYLLLAVLLGVLVLFIWLGMRETSVPQQRIEQDVTNEVLK